MRRIHPDVADDIDLPQAYAYPEQRWLRVNMVASADGGAWLKGLSGGLSSKGDRRIFGVLRGLSDVVLVGAATVRAEGYGPALPRDSWSALRDGRPPAPPIAVLTRRLDLDLCGPLFTEAPPYARTIVITCGAAPGDRLREAARHAEVLVAGEDRVDVTEAVRLLTERGLTRVLCEGGPRVNAQLAAADLVDELCLTISPQLIGGGAARILNGVSTPLDFALRHVLEEEGHLFTSYIRNRT